jgi:hypothetical protein
MPPVQSVNYREPSLRAPITGLRYDQISAHISTCYHESAHDVLARCCFNLPVYRTSVFDKPLFDHPRILPRDRGRKAVGGETVYLSATGLAADQADQQVKIGAVAVDSIIAMAGELAAKRAVGVGDGGEDDWRQVWRGAFDIAGSVPEHVGSVVYDMHRLEKLTGQLVSDYWPQIQQVAWALLDRGSLNENQLDAVLQRS